MEYSENLRMLDGSEEITLDLEDDTITYEEKGQAADNKEKLDIELSENYEDICEIVLDELKDIERNPKLFLEPESRDEDGFRVYVGSEEDRDLAYNEPRGYESAPLITRTVFEELKHLGQNNADDELLRAD